MRERGIATLEDLIDRLARGRDSGLADDVVEALLNNETFFFRDRPSFDLLLKGPMTRIREAKQKTKRLSIWCAGCSTGQEPYSLAMAFAEDRQRWDGWKIDILGTDVSRSAIHRAREGLYSQFEVQRGLSVFQMMRWFAEEGAQQWRASPQLRGAVRFETASLTDSPPRSGPFDLVLCRNVLLYFPPALSRQVFDRLAEASAAHACLMLGAGETIIGQTDAFVSDPDNRGLYLRKPASEPGLRRASAC
jgi:chemotaxis protein methyltransferase CheR